MNTLKTKKHLIRRFILLSALVAGAGFATISGANAQDDAYARAQAQGAQEMSAWSSTNSGTSSAQRSWAGESYDKNTGLTDSSREFMRQSYIRAGRDVPPHLQAEGEGPVAKADSMRGGRVDNTVKSNVRYRMVKGDGKTLYGMPLPRRTFNNVPEGR